MRSTDLPRAAALAAEHQLLLPGATVVCAVSGGADSMCLLHWLSRREGLTVHAAHFDHRLRGEESARDAAFVRDWCRARDIPFHLGGGDVAGEAKRRGKGIEETARELRYAFLFDTAEALGGALIATAHTADDNAETVLLHLLRGTGLQGLTGIPPRRGDLIRPLLTTSRAEVEDYLRRFSLPHVEDSSNADDAFLRNRVRHQLIPLMEELSPGFVDRLTQAIPRLRADNDALNAQARQLFRQARRQGEDLLFPAAVIARAPTAVASRCVRLLLAEADRGNWDCSAAHIDALLSLCRGDDPSAEVHLPGGRVARRVYGNVQLGRTTPRQKPAVFPPKQGKNPIFWATWRVELYAPPWPGLVIRPRQTGDWMTLPSGRSRSLKRLFIDRKIPRHLRERVPVAADGEGVVAVAGLGPNMSHPRSGLLRFIPEKEEKMT